MSYSKDEVKEQLDMNDIYNILEYLDAEPQMFNTYITAKTICHGGDSHKLYYYDNTQLFKCFTGSCGTFDIFELIQKVKDINDLNQAVYFVVNFFNLQSRLSDIDADFDIEDFKILNYFKKLSEIEPRQKQKILLPEINNLIQYYPQPKIINWEKEGILKDVCDYMDIKYDPVNGNVLIPHYDKEHRLIGIRQRAFVQENEIYGKYRPARIQGQLCNHPLAFNLYGFDKSKNNISNMQIAIIFESEKSVLQYISYFGLKNNISVAVCGSSISRYQLQLLLDAGVKEIVLGFDKDFQEMHTQEYDENIKKIDRLYQKLSAEIAVSVLFDQYNLLGYKNSPTDCGKEAFLYLWRNRVIC